jgi:hypothetical protein
VATERTSAIRFLGHQVTPDELTLIKDVVKSCEGLSRMELAHTVCELLGWRRLVGSLKGRECREFLEGLESRGLLRLPEKRKGRPVGRVTSVPRTTLGEEGAPLVCSVGELGRIEIERVRREEERRRFRELVGRYHYLGHAVPFGAQLRYLISAGHAEKTVIGCLQYSSAAWRMAARDQWIGWDDETRGRKLQQVVNNSRFLILPWVRVKNLASRVLSVVAGQMARDWEESYGVAPLLIETLVDGARYAGVCYRAANWIELGVTSGRGRMDGGHQREGVARKKVFVYPLAGDARERLRES